MSKPWTAGFAQSPRCGGQAGCSARGAQSWAVAWLIGKLDPGGGKVTLATKYWTGSQWILGDGSTTTPPGTGDIGVLGGTLTGFAWRNQGLFHSSAQQPSASAA